MDLPSKNKHTELRDKIQEFWKIVYQCRQYYLYCLRLHSAKNEVEAEYLNSSRLFRKTAHVFWRTVVVEIAKIYSNRKSDYYNVQHLIKDLSSKPEFVNDGIDSSMLMAWTSFIETNEETINILLGLRDRFYGHTDTPEKKREIQYDSLTIQQLDPLITMAESIIKQIYLKVFNSSADCRVEFFEEDFDIISSLAEHNVDFPELRPQEFEL